MKPGPRLGLRMEELHIVAAYINLELDHAKVGIESFLMALPAGHQDVVDAPGSEEGGTWAVYTATTMFQDCWT